MNAQMCLIVITFLAAATLALGQHPNSPNVPAGGQVSPPRNPNIQQPQQHVPGKPGGVTEQALAEGKEIPDDLNADGTFWWGGGWGGGFGGWGGGWGGWGGWGRRYPYSGWGSYYRPYGWGGWGW